MTLIEAVAAALSKYMTIRPGEVDGRSAWDLYILMIYGFRMSRALRQTAQIATTECALSCFIWTAGDNLT